MTTNIHKLEIFTDDDAESGPDSVLILKGFRGYQDTQAFLAKILEPEQPENDVIWPSDIVLRYAGLSDTTVRKKVHKGEFPAPIELGSRRKGWIASEVIAWRKARPRRWLGEIRKPVALRKNRPSPSTLTEADTSTAQGLTAGSTRASAPATA